MGGGGQRLGEKEFSVSVLTLIHGPLLCIYDPQLEKEGQHVCLNMTVMFVFHMYSHGFILIMDSLCKEIRVKP